MSRRRDEHERVKEKYLDPRWRIKNPELAAKKKERYLYLERRFKAAETNLSKDIYYCIEALRVLDRAAVNQALGQRRTRREALAVLDDLPLLELEAEVVVLRWSSAKAKPRPCAASIPPQDSSPTPLVSKPTPTKRPKRPAWRGQLASLVAGKALTRPRPPRRRPKKPGERTPAPARATHLLVMLHPLQRFRIAEQTYQREIRAIWGAISMDHAVTAPRLLTAFGKDIVRALDHLAARCVPAGDYDRRLERRVSNFECLCLYPEMVVASGRNPRSLGNKQWFQDTHARRSVNYQSAYLPHMDMTDAPSDSTPPTAGSKRS